MGDVVSIADAAAAFAPLGGEVTATSGPRGGFADRPPPALRFAGAEDEITHILIRAHEGRPLSLTTLYGQTNLQVLQSLCRQLARSPERLIATDASHIKDPFGGEPDPFVLAYIHEAEGPRGYTPGAHLAFVKGVSWVQLNVMLKKPVPDRSPKTTEGASEVSAAAATRSAARAAAAAKAAKEAEAAMTPAATTR